VLLEGVQVGRGCTIQRAIIDKGVVVPEDTKIGVDAEHDRARGFMVTESGLTVIAKLQQVAP
jgi:glucose-1-phosphate adenylyltransferase